MLRSARSEAPDEAVGGSFMTSGKTPALSFDSSAPNELPARPLGDLLASVPEAQVRGDAAVVIRDVTYRSGEVRAGSLFFAVRGNHVDGHDFAADAARAGAVAIVAERPVEARVTQVLVPSVREAMGPISSAAFGNPSSRVTVIGVTGTNGKTTTTYLLESIFRAAGLIPGVIGTTGVRVAGRPVPFDRTTPEAPDLQRVLADMLTEGVAAVAMEVSSHGLDQHRVDGTRYACAVFTNLTQDHLDYHGTMDAYFEAKGRLFTPELAATGAVNLDDPYGRSLAERAAIPTITFGRGQAADVRADGVELSDAGIAFDVDGVEVRSRLRGEFNVSNALGAFAAARQVGIDSRDAARGIAALPGVPGRLEPVEGGQPFAVLVDYAHTPDSLDNVLRAARRLTERRVIVVFGCGGDRDRGKRPQMGEVATRLADLTFVTSDNPRSESPAAIIAEIEAGARRGVHPFAVEVDRRTAIRASLATAEPGDVVIIAGKGHETGQQFRDRTVPFDDRLVAAEELAALMETTR
ncbi:MAG TPA: UDP-N-acetylmuramoyl-L-alanyl-D-glutamate--2,6-diaminopimelate ligase [Actinomycetota bacterium]|nr:UDP-N-acetylmuramoyl-L-alanyl-D-glutamate--2,6-diaminopimelate ligase [Actinomycetota bacterium]